jgi:hypothetical protein
MPLICPWGEVPTYRFSALATRLPEMTEVAAALWMPVKYWPVDEEDCAYALRLSAVVALPTVLRSIRLVAASA